MIQKLRSIGGALALLMMVFVGSTSVEAAEFNKDDPKYGSEELRRANTKVMSAQSLTPGIPCETGACFKPSEGTLGYGEEPLIEPPKDSAPPSKPATKGGTTVD